jgi:hypothetical protein
MFKIGVVLFAIGLFIISPLDEIFILLPLSAVFGLWVFPVALFIGLLCLFLGAFLLGRHAMVYIRNPLVLACIAIAIIFTVYLVYTGGWIDNFMEYLGHA